MSVTDSDGLKKIFHHGPPCSAAMEREVELRKSKEPAAKSPSLTSHAAQT